MEYVTIVKPAGDIVTKPVTGELIEVLAHYAVDRDSALTPALTPAMVLATLRAGDPVYAGLGETPNIYLLSDRPEGALPYRIKLARRRWDMRNHWRYLEEVKRRYPGGSLSS